MATIWARVTVMEEGGLPTVYIGQAYAYLNALPQSTSAGLEG